MEIIARIHNAFPEKFGIPRQSGLVPGLPATIVFEEAYRDPAALRGLELYSHIWLLWGFSQAKQASWSPTVRPPRLGGNKRMGVFATRSPFRPNSIGLSSVKIERIQPEVPCVHVLGADLMDGTPIYDIKPYIPFTDSHPDATGGFPNAALDVCMDERWLACLPEGSEEIVRQLLALDPRPSYQEEAERVYGMAYGDVDIKFRVEGHVLTVVNVVKREEEA